MVEDQSLKQAAKLAHMSEAAIDDCLKQIDDPKTKATLKKATDDALELGVF